ncbi:MAG TPA: lyase family protein [Acidothermaceae bacterium]
MATPSRFDFKGSTRLSSSISEPTSGGLFDGIYGDAAVDAATSDHAWVQAMLDVEAALAFAAARVGLIPLAAASAISEVCHVELVDMAEIARGAVADATPVPALVRSLRDLVPERARSSVHFGATSQDVLDTAMCVMSKRAVAHIAASASNVVRALASLALRHRSTHQVGRTLLQHASVTTFGAACAGRLVALDDALLGLSSVCDNQLAVQLGGAVGTLSAAGDSALELLTEFALLLELPEPVVPWHTSRGRFASLASALGVLAGELAAVAQDLVLLSSNEIGEVSLAAPGGSSAMAHKRNPAAAVLALACAHRVPGLVATVFAGMPQELQRSAGRWQAEWGTLRNELRLVGGTALHTFNAVQGLHVHEDAMAKHVDELLAATGGAGDDIGSATVFVDRALEAHSRRTDATGS